MCRKRGLISRFVHGAHAASAVEFALIAPLLILIVFGIVVWGSYLTIVQDIQQLAAEAARSSIAGISDSERSSLALAYVTANAASYPLVSRSRLTVNAAASASNANVFVVTVQYDASQMFIYSLSGLVPAPPRLIVRSAAIPRGGY